MTPQALSRGLWFYQVHVLKPWWVEGSCLDPIWVYYEHIHWYTKATAHWQGVSAALEYVHVQKPWWAGVAWQHSVGTAALNSHGTTAGRGRKHGISLCARALCIITAHVRLIIFSLLQVPGVRVVPRRRPVRRLLCRQQRAGAAGARLGRPGAVWVVDEHHRGGHGRQQPTVLGKGA